MSALTFRSARTPSAALRAAFFLTATLATSAASASVTPSVASASRSMAAPHVRVPSPRADGPRVYVALVKGAALPFEQVAADLEASLSRAGWKVAGRTDCGVDPSACAYRSRVIVAYTDAYADRVMVSGAHAAFAVPIRFVVWEDENGVNVGATNPMSLNRTIVDEATAPEAWADVVDEMRGIARAAFPTWAAAAEYGQARSEARIGRTMGIMAGGKFTEKIKDAVARPAGTDTPASVARRLVERMRSSSAGGQWGVEPVYVIELPKHQTAIVGVSGRALEARSFGIVRHGGDDARKGMQCPGIDHAAAYPVEVVVSLSGGEIRVQLVDEMYRMKMFFEDAGKVAFAKNMAMPGSVQGEIEAKIRAALGS